MAQRPVDPIKAALPVANEADAPSASMLPFLPQRTTVEAAAVAFARSALPPELQDLADGPLATSLVLAGGYANGTISDNTERAYNAAWAGFRAWAVDCGAPYLPAAPIVVAAYLAERARKPDVPSRRKEGLGKSGLRLILAAISFHHRRANHLWAPNDPAISSVMRGILRNQKRSTTPAAALGTDELRILVSSCGDDLAGFRDRALLLTGFAGALRRSELVALDVIDVRFTRELMTIRIAQSKTDQTGEGADISISRGKHSHICPVRSLELWLEKSGIEYGAIFRQISRHQTIERRLTGQGVGHILARRAGKASLEVDKKERLSPHGLRAGFITEAYLNGALDEQVMKHARQKSLATTQGYRNRAKTIAAAPTKLLNY